MIIHLLNSKDKIFLVFWEYLNLSNISIIRENDCLFELDVDLNSLMGESKRCMWEGF